MNKVTNAARIWRTGHWELDGINVLYESENRIGSGCGTNGCSSMVKIFSTVELLHWRRATVKKRLGNRTESMCMP